MTDKNKADSVAEGLQTLLDEALLANSDLELENEKLRSEIKRLHTKKKSSPDVEKGNGKFFVH